jgi:DNA (cytosine-5)-methyltransferase 1
MRKWARYAEFKSSLEKLGYKLREQILNSAHFGVAQSRRRLFLTADLERQPPKIVPPKRIPKKVADIVELNGTYKWTPLREPNRATATLERADRGIAAMGADKPFLIVYYGSDGGGGWQKLSRPLRTITTVDRFALVKPDTQHGHVMRMLQVPELQAAMGMPAKMKLEAGTRRDRIKMIGNAVCPPVMKHVVGGLIMGKGGNVKAN